MIKYHFKYELRQLLRSRWIAFLSLVLFVLCLFAAYNGQQKVEKRKMNILQAQSEVANGDSMAVVLLDSIGMGFGVNVSSWRLPSKPTALGAYHPRVAAMSPQPLALTATGQSDIYTHYVKPTLTSDDFALNFTELSSPVQLLFGSFDLSFVVIYLLPLIIIAFTYNMLSSEREAGSLRLLAAQPLTLSGWLLQKAGLRFFLLTLIIAIVLLLALSLNGVSVIANWSSVGQLILITIAYLLFWLTLSYVVNLTGKSSANNAISLLALWVGLVLLLPSIVSQLANSFYPVPSRAKMINNMRVVKSEMDKEQDKILEEYLRNHPELVAVERGSEATAYGWWQRYFAAQELLKEEMTPLLSSYDDQLKEQQTWISQWRFISPAILLQDSFNELAGTSSRHYQDYRMQVMAFSQEWRDFFVPMIFKDQSVTKQTMTQLPKFEYQTANLSTHFANNLLGLLLYSGLLTGLGLLWYKRQAVDKILIGE